MSVFRAWRDWADGLDEAEFSRLWLAVGAVAALRKQDAGADSIAELGEAVLPHGELRWLMPGADALQAAKLQGTTARGWLDRIEKKIGNRFHKVPLRIEGGSCDASDEAWLAALTRVAPVATLRLPGEFQRMLGWPLRLSALNEDDRSRLRQCVGMWPADELARLVGVQGDPSSSDLLLHSGEPETLAELIGSRSVEAAILVIVLPRPRHAEDPQRLRALCEAARAGGYVLVEDAGDIDMPGRLRRFIEEMSHARRVDVAASQAFQGTSRPALIALGDDLARFDIRRVAERLHARIADLDRRQALPVAERDALEATMPRSPPMAATEDQRDSALESLGEESAAAPGGLESLGSDAEAPPEAPPASAPVSAAPTIPDYDRLEAPYDHEWGGARGLAEAAALLDRVEAASSNRRFLQQRSYVLRKGRPEAATRGFEIGRVARVRVHIGPPDGESDALSEAFPENALPQELESWDLQVWLAEPTHIPVPLQGSIRLHRRGASSACEFEFRPQSGDPFNGRISVLHRGRVIQTAALRANVHVAGDMSGDGLAPRLESLIRIRRELSGGDRRRFDMALLLNHAGADQPILHAMGAERAWLSNLDVVAKTVADINALLSSAARTARDFVGGLDSKKGADLLRKLAQLGNYLHLYLVESRGAGVARGNDVPAAEFIQIVSTRSDAVVVPFEFIYEFDAPDDTAKPCPNWRDAVANGRCAATCARDEETFCPMGFWGLSKVIERHAMQADLASEGEVAMQSEPVGDRESLRLSGSAVFGCSQRVVDGQLEPLRQQLLAAQLSVSQASDWKDWKARVGQSNPSLLIALAHSDGSGAEATVEIGGKAMKIIGITQAHIRSEGSEHQPLVLLLGCDMAGTGDGYANPVAVCRVRGAAAVVGTMATVLAEDSAEVAARLMRGLTFVDPARSVRLGEAIRDLKRQALLDGELMPLCLVGFGDADWLLCH